MSDLVGNLEVRFSHVTALIMQVTSKILSVNSGAELSSKGRELASHFSTQGTPIMIGGYYLTDASTTLL